MWNVFRWPPNFRGIIFTPIDITLKECRRIQALLPSSRTPYYTHTSNFDLANIFLSQLSGGSRWSRPSGSNSLLLCASGWSYGQVQAWVQDSFTHTNNFDLANTFLRLPGGPDCPDPQEAILGSVGLQDEVRSGPRMYTWSFHPYQ